MPQSKPLSVSVPAVAAQVYVEASLFLSPVLGDDAPDAITLILHELRGRKPRTIAEDYLYCIGWYEDGRAKTRQDSQSQTPRRRRVEKSRTARMRRELVPRMPVMNPQTHGRN
jgi:hypothetical protein